MNHPWMRLRTDLALQNVGPACRNRLHTQAIQRRVPYGFRGAMSMLPVWPLIIRTIPGTVKANSGVICGRIP